MDSLTKPCTLLVLNELEPRSGADIKRDLESGTDVAPAFFFLSLFFFSFFFFSFFFFFLLCFSSAATRRLLLTRDGRID